MLGSVLVPEMERRHYKKSMSLGPILGSGGLAIMIPPSALGVLLATLGNFSVGKFLIAIIFPGLIVAVLYGIYIVGRCWLQKDLAPTYDVAAIPLREKLWETVVYVLPLGIIVFLVLGLIFLGVATPTESAALGTVGSFVLALAYRKLSWKVVRASLSNTLGITIMMFMIFTGSTAFSQLLAYSGASVGLVQSVSALPVPGAMVLVFMQVILFFLGIFMEPLSIMMVTLPIYMPIIHQLGFDPLWFGAIMLLNMEMATTSPPFGLSLFAMKGVAPPDTFMGDIYRAAIPFLVCDAIAMAIMILFPAVVLWLPGLIWS